MLLLVTWNPLLWNNSQPSALLLVTWNLLLWNDSRPDVLLHEISCYEMIPNLVCCYMRYLAMKWSPNPCDRMASKIENFVWFLYVRLKWSFPNTCCGHNSLTHHGTQVYIFTLTKPSLDLGPLKISYKVFNFGVGCGGGDGGSLLYIPRLLLFYFLF